MHDAASLQITDGRKDTQCQNGTTYCEVLLDFNENQFEIWDVTDSTAPVVLSRTSYSNVGYVHSGWWSEDKQYIFVHDETDERNGGLNTTLRVFSVADLRAPTLAGTWTGPTRAIDHNGFVRGNRYYMSNYTRGLTVLDITDPANPAAVGRLDSYPAGDSSLFSGAWGAYPFLWSGSIAISDIDSGLYMAADQTRDVSAGRIEFSTDSFAATEGGQLQFSIQRAVGTQGTVSVAYELVHATADAGDYSPVTGLVQWADGDSSDRTIILDATGDGVAEPMEQLLVRLVNPTGGATLGNRNTASGWISDPNSTSVIEFDISTVSVTERGFATAIAVVQRTGSAVGSASVDVTVAGTATPGTDFQGPGTTTLNWADGDATPKWLEFNLIDDGVVEANETINLSLGNPVGATMGSISTFDIQLLDADGSNVAPNAIAGASQTRPSGSVVQLTGSGSNDPDGDNLTYLWQQTSGAPVTLANVNSADTSFTAPSVSSDTLLQFDLTVTDPGGLSDSASTSVTITSSTSGSGGNTAGGGGGGGGSGSPGPAVFLILLLLYGRRLTRTDAA